MRLKARNRRGRQVSESWRRPDLLDILYNDAELIETLVRPLDTLRNTEYTAVGRKLEIKN
jgi:hypothetical protein